MKNGIDISKWNGVIDFAKVKNDPKAEFVIIRATNGLKKVDTMFSLNAQKCVENGIPWGAYHFFDFKEVAEMQVRKFIDTVTLFGNPSMPMVLDVETNKTTLPISAKQLEDFCNLFLSTIEKEGFDPMIYMSAGFSWFLRKGHTLTKYKLWVADYDKPINAINGWENPYMHQYSQEGKINGIKTNTDLNVIL